MITELEQYNCGNCPYYNQGQCLLCKFLVNPQLAPEHICWFRRKPIPYDKARFVFVADELGPFLRKEKINKKRYPWCIACVFTGREICSSCFDGSAFSWNTPELC